MTNTKKIFALSMIAALPTTALADWTGGYAGLSVGTTINSELTAEGEGTFEIDDAAIYGGFAGYQVQNGTLVYGGEIAISDAPDAILVAEPDYSVDAPVIDVKGRLGYAFGDALAYGVLGFSSLSVSNGSQDLDSTGFNFGAGIDYLVGDNIVLGAEYLARRTSGEESGNDFDTDLDSFSLRASFKF